jgi:AraC-like DNA-binding protein
MYNCFAMEAKFIKIINPADASFVIKTDDIPPKNLWHYHPEFEIIYVKEARGTRFIGDSIESITEGEILLLGQNLPHTFQREKQYYENHKPLVPQILVVQFDKDFLGADMWGKTEFLAIAELLNKSARGLRFTVPTADKAANLLLRMIEQRGVKKIMHLLCVLEELAFSRELNYISSPGFLKHYDETDEKINQAYEFTINNFREDITLEKIASHVYLSQSSFCRYFKSKTRKTYSRFLAEVRIGYACKLLLQEKLNISEICYECGYKNLSNFNRHFKAIMHITPSEYYIRFDTAAHEKNVA